MLLLQTAPDHFSMQTELILAMTYGYEPQGRHDGMIEIAKRFSDLRSNQTLLGTLLVNSLPFRTYYFIFQCMIEFLLMATTIVRHVPEWLPWLSYKPIARLGYNVGQEAIHRPIRFVRESVVRDCFVSARVRRAHCVTLIAQWHSATLTRSPEFTGGGEPKRIRTQKD
jgi:hypothetical protein